jgi:hypothetical protein
MISSLGHVRGGAAARRRVDNTFRVVGAMSERMADLASELKRLRP